MMKMKVSHHGMICSDKVTFLAWVWVWMGMVDLGLLARTMIMIRWRYTHNGRIGIVFHDTDGSK